MQAQDIHFSQYHYSPLNLSPSQTGLMNGDIRANAFYRQQWKSITVPYKTFGIAYDQVVGLPSLKGSRHSGGIMINNDRAGDGNFGTLQLMLSYARLIALGNDSVHFISLGAQAGFGYSSLDINKLTFDNQYNGDVYNPQASSGETFDRTSYIYPDVNAGITWMSIFSNQTLYIGGGFQHLISSDQSLLGEENGLPRHLQAHVSCWLNRDSKISFFPSVYIGKQGKFQELLFGSEIKFRSGENSIRDKSFSLGLHYRNNDALIPSFALQYDLWRLGISYDINTSDLNTVSNSRGGPEINLTYLMKKIRYTKVKNICPVY